MLTVVRSVFVKLTLIVCGELTISYVFVFLGHNTCEVCNANSICVARIANIIKTSKNENYFNWIGCWAKSLPLQCDIEIYISSDEI